MYVYSIVALYRKQSLTYHMNHNSRLTNEYDLLKPKKLLEAEEQREFKGLFTS